MGPISFLGRLRFPDDTERISTWLSHADLRWAYHTSELVYRTITSVWEGDKTQRICRPIPSPRPLHLSAYSSGYTHTPISVSMRPSSHTTWLTSLTAHSTTGHGTACSVCGSNVVTLMTRRSQTPSSTSSRPYCLPCYSCSSSANGGTRPHPRETSRRRRTDRPGRTTRPYSPRALYPSYRQTVFPSRPRRHLHRRLATRRSCTRSRTRRMAIARCVARNGRTPRYCPRDGSCAGNAGGMRWERRMGMRMFPGHVR